MKEVGHKRAHIRCPIYIKGLAEANPRRQWLPGAGRGREVQLDCRRVGVPFGGDENVLHLDGDDGCTNL